MTIYKANENHAFITFLRITLLIFLILVNLAGALTESQTLVNHGNDFVKSGKYDEALKAFDKAIELNPQNPIALDGKGTALYNLNKSNEELKAFDKAIELNPQDTIALNGKGIALRDLGKSDEALKAFDKAIELNPQDTIALNGKGSCST